MCDKILDIYCSNRLYSSFAIQNGYNYILVIKVEKKIAFNLLVVL